MRARDINVTCASALQGYVDYKEGERPSEQSLVSARNPREIHVHVTRYPLAELPEGEPAMAAWVQDRFREKEQRLQRFYEGDSSSAKFASKNSFAFEEKGACATDANLPKVRCTFRPIDCTDAT